MDHFSHTKAIPPLEPHLYALDTESLAFFMSTTGIYDEDELKAHILDVQRQAYDVVPYPCIRSFSFTKYTLIILDQRLTAHVLARVRISRAPVYSDVLKLGRERKGALLLDIGCAFGHDARKAALDGFPVKQIIASDVRQELWDLGHVLFRSSPDSFPATFVNGDVFDLSPFTSGSQLPTEVNVSNITTLNVLHGKVSAIWASSLFHLFSEQDQHRLARALGSLLSPGRGSILFGTHVALPSKGILSGRISERDVHMFCHDPMSWKEMWVGQSTDQNSSTLGVDPANNPDGAVFSPDSVTLDTTLVPTKSEAGDHWMWFMVWSITRL